MNNIVIWTAIGVMLTLAVFLSTAIYRSGHLSARVEELERWRGTIRQDMHEISECLGLLTTEVKRLATLIEERTDRRINPREDK